MSVVAGEVSLVDRFRELQPEVVASFGGSEFSSPAGGKMYQRPIRRT